MATTVNRPPGFHRSPHVAKDRESAIEEAARFLSMSVKAVDLAMTEDGFAHRNPQLLAAFMQAALLDFHATRFGELLEFIEAVSRRSLSISALIAVDRCSASGELCPRPPKNLNHRPNPASRRSANITCL
jgi:hypothetical protein